MQTMALKTRLLLQASLTVMLVLLLVGVGLYELNRFAVETDQGLARIQRENQAMLAIENAHAHFKIQVQEWKNILIRGNDKEKFNRYLKQFGDEEKVVQESLRNAAEVLTTLGLESREVEATRQAHSELGKKYREALKGFAHDDANSGKDVDKAVTGIDRETSKNMEKILGFIEEHFARQVTLQIQSGQSLYAASQTQLLVIAGFGLGVIIIFSLGILRSIMNSLGGEPALAVSVTRRIANGDLAAPVPLAMGDEHSLLASMGHMQGALREVVGDLNQNVRHVTACSSELFASSDSLSESAARQSSATASMAAAIEQLSTSIDQVADNSEDARAVTQNAVRRSADSAAVIQQAIDEMHHIADAVTQTASSIRQLEDKAGEISNIVNVIKEIADQTNLLALNAAIEAARAGEQGRGFAVVADEVRKLAERTSQATLEITGMIGSIQSQAENAADSMDSGVNQVQVGVKLASRASDEVAHMQEDSQRITAVVDAINAALKEQSAATREIASRVETVSQDTEKMAASSLQTKQAAQSLEKLAAALQQLAGRFRLSTPDFRS